MKTKRLGKLSTYVLYFRTMPVYYGETIECIQDCGFEQLEHPPYSPDLAPSNFHVFDSIKDPKFLHESQVLGGWQDSASGEWVALHDATKLRQGWNYEAFQKIDPVHRSWGRIFRKMMLGVILFS